MKKFILLVLMAAPGWASQNNIYNIHTDTLTIQNAIVFPDGTIQVSSPTAGGGSAPGTTGDLIYNSGNLFSAVTGITTDGVNTLTNDDGGGNVCSVLPGSVIISGNAASPNDPKIVYNASSGNNGETGLASTNGDAYEIHGTSFGGGVLAGPTLASFPQSGGVVLTHLTTTQRNAIASPIEGQMIVNVSSHTIDYFNGTAWKSLATQ